ncbi:glycerophosphodiester phosphodiesterase family protein [Shewanella sp. UCD-KL12]|uniref:glycerophosphodiester phosphodiesterase family protein n=1 Tax=Shewanella sp. UCD-KL12 TaxID=1917163 RepID=UPI0009709F77|nr:glycerophosphodiester phosphodiesterase family protein [Shewanella sp. UCD-KL12]
MLLKIALFSLLAFTLVSFSKPLVLKRLLTGLVALFLLMQLVVIQLKGDFAAYIDFEELYFSTGLLQALSLFDWLIVASTFFLILVGSQLFITYVMDGRLDRHTGWLTDRLKLSTSSSTKLKLSHLLLLILACISFASSVSLYRYSFVLVRNTLDNLTRYSTPHLDPYSTSDLNTYVDANEKISDRLGVSAEASSEYVLSRLGDTQFGDAYAIIAHAGGGVQLADDASYLFDKYTNSMGAVEHSIRDGKKLIEIDFISTSDGVLIGGHDWPRVKGILAYQGITDRGLHDAKPLSFDEFVKLREKSSVKPVDLLQLNQLFKQYTDLILVTDKTRDYGQIIDKFDFTERLIVECFSLVQCRRAKRHGVINTALNAHMQNRDLVNYLVRNEIMMVTYRGVSPADKLAYANAVALNKQGIVSLVYTSKDDIDYIRANIGITASAIYSDYFSVDKQVLFTQP